MKTLRVLCILSFAVVALQGETSVSARYLRITKGAGILSLAEVEVYVGGQNAALKGSASQSSTGSGGDAGRAIDGNTSGDFFVKSTSSTAEGNNVWWELDLGREVPVESVKLWNRTDCCGDRLLEAEVVFLSADRKPVHRVKIETVRANPVEFVFKKDTRVGEVLPTPNHPNVWRSAYVHQSDAARAQFPAAAVPWKYYTHVMHGPISPLYQSNPEKVSFSDASKVLMNAKAMTDEGHRYGVKVLLWMIVRPAEHFWILSNTAPGRIDRFVDLCAALVISNHYDGFDFDWEGGQLDDQFVAFIKKLRGKLPRPYVITLAESPWHREWLRNVVDEVDQINLMTYDMEQDYSGVLSNVVTTWYHFALRRPSSFPRASLGNMKTAQQHVEYLLDAGVPSMKIGLGIPFYGKLRRGALLEDPSKGITGALQKVAVGTPPDWSKYPLSIYTYSDILNNKDNILSSAYGYDEIYKSAYRMCRPEPGVRSVLSNSGFLSFADPRSVRDAVELFKDLKLGGLMTFSPSYEYMKSESADPKKYPLSHALYEALLE